MATVKKLVECIAKIDEKGNIEPMRFRFEDDDGNHVIQITEIIERDRKDGFGNMHGNPVKIHSFKCQSIIEGMVVPYKLQCETRGVACTWSMLIEQ